MTHRFPALNVMKGIVMGMTEYDKLIYFDSDMLILEAMPELQLMPSGSAVPGLMYAAGKRKTERK